MDISWDLQDLTKQAITKTLQTHDSYQSSPWDDIGSLLANASRGFYLKSGASIDPYWDDDPERQSYQNLFPGFSFKIVKQVDKKKWDVFTPNSLSQPVETLKTERGAWKWVKERVDEGYYQIIHVGVDIRGQHMGQPHYLTPSSSSSTTSTSNTQVDIKPTDKQYARAFMDEAMRKFLPSYSYTDLLSQLSKMNQD